MNHPEYPEDFIRRLKAVKGKRPRTVIEHILKHGQISTEELKSVYGYNHPPRAVRGGLILYGLVPKSLIMNN